MNYKYSVQNSTEFNIVPQKLKGKSSNGTTQCKTVTITVTVTASVRENRPLSWKGFNMMLWMVLFRCLWISQTVSHRVSEQISVGMDTNRIPLTREMVRIHGNCPFIVPWDGSLNGRTVLCTNEFFYQKMEAVNKKMLVIKEVFNTLAVLLSPIY